MSVFYQEKSAIPIAGEYDLIVVGGGVAGVAAALAARRMGLQTLLVEKSVILGGLATLGHIVIYLPLCDGQGRQVIGGIAEELLQLSIKYGYDDLAKQKRYRTTFNAPAFVLALDELMVDAGVDLLFDTVFSRPVMDDGSCQGIIVENKSGRQLYTCRTIIDTTGDADVMARAGAECVEGDNWLTFWGYHSDLDVMQKAVETGDVMQAVGLLRCGAGPAGQGAESRKYSGVDARDVTEFVLAGRRMAKEFVKKKDKKQYSLLALPGMAQFRTTRRITGFYELTSADVFARFEDSVGCVGDWRKAGPIYEIPYRTLIAPGLKNMLTAGRTIAAKDDAWEVTRVIPVAALTGQAAGTAAALALESGEDVAQIDIQKLQTFLEDTGVLIHI